MAVPQKKQREFDFEDKHFQFVKELIFKETGIALSDIKKDMVYGRLTRRIRDLNLNSFDEYLELLQSNLGAELTDFINSLTTNLTSFFRENHHFEILGQQLLPQLMKSKTNKRIRVWSAGCSTGEEPYSIAITLRQALGQTSTWDARVLATDLDSNVVATAKAGIYDASRINNLPENVWKRWFKKGRNDLEGKIKLDSDIQKMITFKQLNLMNDWPMKGPFDYIFCRNVVIYFNKDTQRVLFNRFAEKLAPNGYLFVGHSESLHKVTDRFKLIGHTIYQRLY